MNQMPRHQCLIYRGVPSEQLASLALMIRKRLDENYRCLYLHSPGMVAGIRAYLMSSGLDVHDAVVSGRLILSSSQDHLVNDAFDPRRMLELLKATHDEALREGYAGLWASGDMRWEFGPAEDFSKLVEYERALEEFFVAHPTMHGVCQYHADGLTGDVLMHGLKVHRGIFENHSVSRVNPQYVPA
jgi:hypothetical protein